jgi:hypothetical protein
MANKDRLRGKLIAYAGAAWIVFLALYLLFTGTGKPAELAVGGVAAALVTGFGAAARARHESRIKITLPALWQLVPASGQLVVDIFRVAGALLIAFRGPLPAASVRSPPPRSPNAFVVSILPGDSRFTVHRLGRLTNGAAQ